MERQMGKDIKLMDELGLFMVPVYSFNNRDAGDVYFDSTYGGINLYDPQAIADLNRGIGYVMIPGWWDSNLSTSLLTERPYRHRGQTGPDQKWEKLRSADTPRPRDGARPAFTNVLLVGGRRQYFRHLSRDSMHNTGWWKRLVEGPRDCFAVWTHRDGQRLEPIRRFDNGEESPNRKTKSIYAARSGRGAIYAATTVYAKDGSIEGNEMRLLLVEFQVLDRDDRKDDQLRVTIVSQSYQLAQPGSHIPEIELSRDLDPLWTEIADAARRGFIRECAPSNHELEEYRVFIVGQLARLKADEKLPYDRKFSTRIRDLNWEDALRLVKEPWQFAVVAGEHAHQGRFSSDGGMYTILSECVPEMIQQHGCSPERKDELMGMVSFMQETNTLWNYRGD